MFLVSPCRCLCPIQWHQVLRFLYCLAAFFVESLEARCQVENGDVVEAAPTGDAPTTSEWSTILLLTKVLLILETWRYFCQRTFVIILRVLHILLLAKEVQEEDVTLTLVPCIQQTHYIDVIMTTIASHITSLTVVYSTVYSDADQRKHQSSASLAFVLGIHRDRWILRTKGQLRGKCFHLMTSSW